MNEFRAAGERGVFCQLCHAYTNPHKESPIHGHEAPFIRDRKPTSMSDSFRGLVLLPGLWRDLPRTAILPDDDKGKLGLGHLDALAAPVPERPNFHIQRDRGASDPLYVGVKADRIANLHWLHEHHV